MSNKFPEFKLTKEQHETLLALMDTIMAPLTEADAEVLVETAKNHKGHTLSRDEIMTFAKAKASDFDIVGAFIDSLTRAAAAQKLNDVTLALNLLSSRAGTLALTGHFTAFKDLSRKDRDEIMRKWSLSPLLMLRSIHKLFYQLTASNVFRQTGSPLHKVIGYPGPDPHMHGNKHTDKLKDRYEFIQVPEGVTELTFDAVIIGSGAGGGPVAATLAKAGKSVLVLEKAKYLHESEFELNEAHGFKNFYERETVFSNLDGSVNIYAGSAFGGGTTINWCASLKVCSNVLQLVVLGKRSSRNFHFIPFQSQPQHFVRQEWAKQGLNHFVSSKFTDQLAQVYDRIGATTKYITHNEPNQILIDGCKYVKNLSVFS
jgi:hypothetical protein